MQFNFVPCSTIPRLAWSAHLRRGAEVVRVYHGPWVETRDTWFADGAWTGPFDQGELDTALFVVGSGAVIRGTRVVFCSQTDTIERLYSLRAGDDLFVSNSLVFILTMAGDELDPCDPFYDYQLKKLFCRGIDRPHKTICTRARRRVALHDYCQIAIGNDLRIVRLEKPAFPRPATFERCVSMVQGVVSAVLDNASDPRRWCQRYAGLAMVSGGYDANATAVLAGRAGVREAVTFYNKGPGDDSGEDIARRLGMEVHVYGRTDFRSRPGPAEVEFLSYPEKTTDIVMAACEPQLSGKVLVTGRNGDSAFAKTPTGPLRNLRRPRWRPYIGGRRMIEFRLRVGFLNFSPWFAVGLHLPAMRTITESAAMAPWRLDGDYDRPIPRRIVEEAGIPRGAFATAKRITANFTFRSPADLSPEGCADFKAYRAAMPRAWWTRRLWHRGLVGFRSAGERAAKTLQSVWSGADKAAKTAVLTRWRSRNWDDTDYLAHWGQARIRGRYAEAVGAYTRHSTSDVVLVDKPLARRAWM